MALVQAIGSRGTLRFVQHRAACGHAQAQVFFHRLQGYTHPCSDLGLRQFMDFVHDEYHLAARWQFGNGLRQAFELPGRVILL
ncbi:hypothetical protein D3C76_1565010 [compost metagenome]